MKIFRRLGFSLWLALALVAGQHAALLHDLGHATERLATSGKSNVPPAKCDLHFACSQIAGGLGATAFVAVFVPAAPPRARAHAVTVASLAPRLAFRSQAPPADLA